MSIEWNKVTRLSQIVAIVLFVGIFIWGFCLGRKYQTETILGKPINRTVFVCPDGEKIYTDFYDREVYMNLKGFGTLYLRQTISASGARYANKDESIVLWNKGDTVFLQKDGKTVMDNCEASK